MARQLRKCVALAPVCGGTFCAEGDYRYRGVPTQFKNTATNWIRVWADWPFLQPQGPTQFSQADLEGLDTNIKLARNAPVRGQPSRPDLPKLNVILTTRRYPLWANGTQSLLNSDGNVDPNDPCVQRVAVDRPGLTNRDVTPAQRKEVLTFRFPRATPLRAAGGCPDELYRFDVGDGSDFYWWLKFLAVRYAKNRDPDRLPDRYGPYGLAPEGAWIDALEFVNEPTGAEGWPQRGLGEGLGERVSVRVTADMFETARLIRERDLPGAGYPFMLGPASQDRLGSDTRTATAVDTFTDALLTELRDRGFQETANFIWTHHNYTDVTRLRTLPPTAAGKRNPERPQRTNGAALVRNLLAKHRWAGWPNADPRDPRLWLTEGGLVRSFIPDPDTNLPDVRPPARREAIRRRRDALQQQRLAAIWNEMLDERGLGRGVSMFTQFLFYQKPESSEYAPKDIFDTGLRVPVDFGGQKRPAYATWRNLKKTKR